MLANFLYIILGASCGASLRYLAVLFLPAPILLVNVIGSFLIGIFSVKFAGSAQMLLFICLGFLGSLTTFSSFSLELIQDLQAGLLLRAASYACGSVLLCVGACFLGIRLAS